MPIPVISLMASLLLATGLVYTQHHKPMWLVRYPKTSDLFYGLTAVLMVFGVIGMMFV